MPQPIPYLSFNGNCAEAMHFYEKVLNGKIEMMMKNADTPFAAQTPKEHLDRVMHARLALGNNAYLYGGDCPAQMPYEGIKGISLALQYDTVAEAQKVFKSLSEGGQITMPMDATFWAKAFGMVKDKFGVDWAVNGEMQPM
jgi:PhnB protein